MASLDQEKMIVESGVRTFITSGLSASKILFEMGTNNKWAGLFVRLEVGTAHRHRVDETNLLR
jgi:hypothetical protein